MKTRLRERSAVCTVAARQLRRLPKQLILAKWTRPATFTRVSGYKSDGAREIEFSMSIVRVLIVDDFDPWRTFVIQHLNDHPHFRTLGCASDGLEGLQKAEELQPDLILLDISLPKLNGIDLARKVRKLVPKAKILFLSSSADPDVVRAAFCAGGAGYILKSDAGGALLPGMEAVLLGKQYVSSTLSGIEDLAASAE
jgi:DNA-binding NarL/FixJ family response regulator